MKRFKPINSGISNIKLATRATIITFFTITSSIVIILAMIKGIYTSSQKRHKDMEKTIIASSQHIVEMTIENSVNIVKSIYTNQSIYNFLNTEYPSNSDYYDAFYKFKQGNNMLMAETNFITNCIIYTENPTIINGGNISSFQSVKEEKWYHTYKKLNKPIILYIDSETNIVSLIRRLDFQNLKTGESCLKIDINMSLIKNYFDDLNFNGELYIINDGSLIYSNNENNTLENISINPEFECYIKNYYTSDIEYYAYEKRSSVLSFIKENILFIIAFAVITGITITCIYLFNHNIKKRLNKFEEEIKSGKKYNSLSGNGKDEIGKFIDLFRNTAEKFDACNNDLIRTNIELQQTKTRYNELFSTVMNFDTELYINENYPKINNDYPEYITIDEEIQNMKTITNNITSIGTTDIKVPKYSFMMIAENLADKSLSVNILKTKDTLTVTYKRNPICEQTKVLKIYAIFEDSNITNKYSFSRNNPYNCYMRIIHCFKDKISVDINNNNNFSICMTIKEKGDLNEC